MKGQKGKPGWRNTGRNVFKMNVQMRGANSGLLKSRCLDRSGCVRDLLGKISVNGK